MKKLLKLLPFFLATVALFSSCSDDDDDSGSSYSDQIEGAYIVNYGGYEVGSSSITKYNYNDDEVTQYYYQLQNDYSPITSAPQFAYNYEGTIYLMNNAPDNIISVNEMFVIQDTITTSIVKPRACAGYGDYLYISCWGPNPDWADLPNSYIVKYNVLTGNVEETISLPGGPEGVQIVNGKLYAALNYKQAVAVMDLSTEEISYIETPAVASSLIKDDNDNLYVALISSYTHAATQTGLGYINTSTNEITVYDLDNVSTAYASIITLSKDQSKVYIIAAVYNDTYTAMNGGIQVFDVETKAFESEPFLSGLEGINGISVNPENGDIYVLMSNGSTTKGTMQIYSADGTYEDTKTVGAAPAMALFLD